MAICSPKTTCSVSPIIVTLPQSSEDGRLMYISQATMLAVTQQMRKSLYLQTLQADQCKQSSRTCTLTSFSRKCWHVGK